MPLRDYVTGRQNKILIGSTAGVGLLITTLASVYYTSVQPAFQIEEPDGDVVFTVSDHGAIGVKSGSGVDFGSADDCLKSGGSSGSTMTFGNCGTPGVSTGSLQSAFDDRYVNTSGDTMTGALSVRANISGSTLNVDSLQNCNTIDTDADGRLVCGTDDGANYTAGQGLSLNGSSFSVNAVLTGSLVSFTTVSGSTIYGTSSLRSSGSLVWEGAASGASIWVSKFEGAGLLDCDAATDKLLWDTTTGKFSCGTDDDVPESGDFGAASDLDSDGSISSDAVSTSKILDGTIIEADLNATSTPTDGDILSYNSAGSNFEWLVVDPGTDITVDLEEEFHNTEHYAGEPDELKLELLASDCSDAQVLGGDGAGGAECQTDQNTTYTAGNGLTLNGTSFSLNSLLTGSILRMSQSVNSSGSLVWEGAGSGASLYVATSLRGSGLTDCDSSTSKLFWDTTTGRFSCGTDQQGATLAFLNVAVKNQSNVVADSDSDTLTLTGSRIKITSDATTDTVTFTAPSAAQGLSYAYNYYRLNSTITGSLVSFQTLSGASLNVNGDATIGKDSSSTVTLNSGIMALNNALSIDGDTMYIDPSSNLVGVGTVPAQKFHVFNEINSTGIYKNILSVSSGALASNGNLFQLALSFECYTSPISGVTDGGYCMGFDGVSQLRGDGTISEVYGSRYTVGTNVLAGGTVTTAYGVRPRILNLGSGNGASIGTAYGLYLDNIQATSAFGIYQLGADDKNYFGGDVGINTTSPAVKLHVRSTSDTNILRLQDSDGTCDHNPEAGSETVTCSSDRRLKEDIKEASGVSVLSSLMKYNIKDYRVKASGKRLLGVIADEVQLANPEKVHLIESPAEFSGSTLIRPATSHLGVEQPTTWELVLAIQELTKRVQQLEREIISIKIPAGNAR